MTRANFKAIRGLAAVASALVLVGCETTANSDTVPRRTVEAEMAPPPVVVVSAPAPQPVLVAQAPATIPPPAPQSATTPAPANNIEPASTNETVEVRQIVEPATPANLNLSEGVKNVLKLAQAQTDEKVLEAYVAKYATKFDLETDEILYLADMGVPSSVVAAMLKHDGEDPAKAENVTAADASDTAQPALPLPGTVPSGLEQPATVEVTTNYVPNAQTVIVQQQPPQPQTIVVQQQPQVVYAQPEAVTTFYDSLSPYGSWMYVSDYGWCWQPSVATINVGWRPYGHNGRWLWTADGWYWNSYYTWGWAPFHYGRWAHAGHRGWLWVPDRTWGPSWVTWRSSGDYCGWAPLPPAAHFVPGVGFSYRGRGVDVSFGFGLGYDAFCFTPYRSFYHHRVYDHALPRHQVRGAFSSSRVENRFEVHRDRFVNNGVPHDRVARASGREIRATEVREMPRQDVARFGARERIERSGRQEVVYRPNLSAAASVARPSANTRSVPAGARTPTSSAPQSGRTRTDLGTRSPVVSNPAPAVNTPQPTAPNRTVDRTNRRPTGSVEAPGRSIPSGSSVNQPATVAPVAQPKPTGPGTVVDPNTRRGVGRDRVETARPSVTPLTSPAPARPDNTPKINPPPAARELRPRAIEKANSSGSAVPSTVAPRVTTPAPAYSAPAPRITPLPSQAVVQPRVTIPSTPAPRVAQPRTVTVTQPSPRQAPPSAPVVRTPQPSAPQRSAPPSVQPSQDRRSAPSGGGERGGNGGGGGRPDRRGRE